MRKSSELTLRLQVAVFTRFFFGEKWGDVTTRPPFSGYTMRKGGVAFLRRPTFEPLFTTHRSEVGSTSPWTRLAEMMRGPLSHPICRQATAFCGGFARDSRCIGLVILSSLSTCHEMCHRIPRLPLATNCT